MTWPWYSDACRREVDELLKAGGTLSKYRASKAWGVGSSEGSKVWEFERALEKKFKVRHAVAVNSGTMALQAAIYALDLPAGKDVMTTPFSFSATPASVVMSNLVPRFADVNRENFCIDAETIKTAWTKNVGALLPVDLFGHLNDYTPLRDFGVPIIQDYCQSVGASRDGRYLWGDIACASGNGMKNLPMGEGGFCLTDNEKYAERMRLFINHMENYDHAEVSWNGRLHEVVAVLARHALYDLDDRNMRRAELATTIFPDYPLWPHHVYYCVPFLVSCDRDEFLKGCDARGLKLGKDIGGGYIRPSLEKYPAFRRYVDRDLPVVTELTDKSLCLLYTVTPDKSVEDAERIRSIIEEAMCASSR